MQRAAMTPLPRKMRSTDFISSAGIRLWNPQTQCYLHMSGRGEVKDIFYSWRGFNYQADALKRNAISRGEDWPYMARDVGTENTPDG